MMVGLFVSRLALLSTVPSVWELRFADEPMAFASKCVLDCTWVFHRLRAVSEGDIAVTPFTFAFPLM